MIRVSASKLALLKHCGYWARDGVAWSRHESDEAAFGIALHAMAAAYISGSFDAGRRWAELGEREQRQLDGVWALVKRYIDAHRTGTWSAEVVFALDMTTGRSRCVDPGSHGHRSYEAMGIDLTRELPGTADIVYVLEDEHGYFVCVDDWKWSGFHGDAADAEDQLCGLGLMAARACGVDRVRCRAIRVSDDGIDDTSEVYWLDAFDLDGLQFELAERLLFVETAEPQPGPWCGDRWCPAVASCPRAQEAMAQLIPETRLAKGMRLGLEIHGAEHAAWSLVALEQVEGAAKMVAGALREWADKNGGIRLADGSVWSGAEVTTEKADLSVLGAVEELRALGLDAAVERTESVTWAAINRIGGAAAEKRAREALRAIGATKTSSYMRYEARRPKAGRRKGAA